MAVNAPYEKSKDVKKQYTKSPRGRVNKSRQREIKNASDFSETFFLLFLRNKVNYSESALSYMGSYCRAYVSENGIIKVISFFL